MCSVIIAEQALQCDSYPTVYLCRKTVVCLNLMNFCACTHGVCFVYFSHAWFPHCMLKQLILKSTPVLSTCMYLASIAHVLPTHWLHASDWPYHNIAHVYVRNYVLSTEMCALEWPDLSLLWAVIISTTEMSGVRWEIPLPMHMIPLKILAIDSSFIHM